MRTIISLFTCSDDPVVRAQVEDENPLDFSDVNPEEVTAVVNAAWFDEEAENDLVDLVADMDDDHVLSLNEEQIAILFSDFERTVNEERTGTPTMHQWDRFRDKIESEFDTNPDEWLAKNFLFIHKLRA